MNGYLKSIMDIMRRDKAKGPMEYIPELTWMMFVRLLDEKEEKQKEEAEITGDDFKNSLEYPFRWQDYAWKDVENIFVVDNKNLNIERKLLEEIVYKSETVLDWKGNRTYFKQDFKNSEIYKNFKKEIDEVLKNAETINTAVWWDKRVELKENWKEVLDFVNEELIPFLKSFVDNPKASSKQKLISLIFDHIEKTKISAEVNLLEIFERIHHISDNKISGENFFAMSQIYESLLLKMGDKNSDWGQFFTPRSVIKTMVTVIDPKIESSFYDPCCGTGGFLAETYKYLYSNHKLTTKQLEFLSEKAFWWKDNSDTVFAITLANLVVHNISMPHISNENTLTGHITNNDLFKWAPAQFDYIFTNPPFWGKESKELIAGTDFAYKTNNTQLLFIQHVIDKLKTGWECAIVLDEWVLFRTNENAFVKTKELLMTECDLHTIVSLPAWVFTSTWAWVKTNLLFFKKGKKTKKTWYYDMSDLKVNKWNPLTYNKFGEFLELYKTKKETKKSWFVSFKEIEKKNFDIKAVNPNIKEEIIRPTEEIVDKLIEDISKVKEMMEEIKRSLK